MSGDKKKRSVAEPDNSVCLLKTAKKEHLIKTHRFYEKHGGSEVMLRKKRVKNEEKYEKKIYCLYRCYDIDFSIGGFS
jgi:hypothetical protein